MAPRCPIGFVLGSKADNEPRTVHALFHPARIWASMQAPIPT
jgi:hypothetical protein